MKPRACITNELPRLEVTLMQDLVSKINSENKQRVMFRIWPQARMRR